jgi:hypothetical protein
MYMYILIYMYNVNTEYLYTTANICALYIHMQHMYVHIHMYIHTCVYVDIAYIVYIPPNHSRQCPTPLRDCIRYEYKKTVHDTNTRRPRIYVPCLSTSTPNTSIRESIRYEYMQDVATM